ncbi:MAG: cytochrome c biogenesis protein ResB [Peptococcaceae bacterium]|nr:cytochrome c biogenesis protein ResB [Peptococcaceae bacterium]
MGDQLYNKNMLRFWRFFASMRFGLILMFLLAGAATLGILLPQEITTQNTLLGQISSFLGLNNVFATWWFHTLAYLLVLNASVCTLHRVSAVISVLRSPRMTVNAYDRLQAYQTFTTKERQQEVIDSFIQVLKSNRYRVLQSEDEEQPQLYADKQRLEVLGPVVLHSGIFILALGLTGLSLSGFAGTLTIPVGSSAPLSAMQQTTGTVNRNFAIRVDSAEQLITRTGLLNTAPNVSILANDAVVKTGQVEFNAPFTYQGVNIHLVQFIHGELVAVNGKPQIIRPNQPNYFPLTPTNDLYVAFTNMHPDPNRPTVDYMIVQPSSPQPLAQGSLRAGEGENYQNQFSFSLIGYQGSAVLHATSQPGLNFVLTGALVLLGGMFLTLYLRYRKIWLSFIADGDQLQVMAGGYSAKERLRFAIEFKALIDEARSLVGG